MLRFTLTGSIALLAIAATPCSAADGVPDPTFGTDGAAFVTPDDVAARSMTPNAALVQPDGKLLIAGARNKLVAGSPPFEPQIRGMLVRLNADGSPDMAFGNTSIPGLFDVPDLVPNTRMQSLESFVRLGDGSIVAVGTGMVNSPSRGFVVKLTPAGELDFNFGTDGTVLIPAFSPHSVAIDSTGRIVVGGEHFDSGAFVYTSTVLRFASNGAVDTQFGGTGTVAISWSDATLSGYIHELALTSDDRIVVGGAFEAYGSGLGSDFALARLDSAGALDTTFATVGWSVFHDATETSNINGIERFVLDADGAITFAGYHTAGENITGLILGRVDANGAVDTSFGDVGSPGFFKPGVPATAESVNASAMVRQDDGKIAVSAAYYAEQENVFVLRIDANGQLDAGFANAGIFETDLAPTGVYSEISAMALQPDGNLILAGRAMRSTSSPVVDLAAMRLLSSGSEQIFADGFD